MKSYSVTLIASLFGIIFGFIFEPIIGSIFKKEISDINTALLISEIVQIVFMFVIIFLLSYLLYIFTRHHNEFTEANKNVLHKLGADVSYYPVGDNTDNLYKKMSEIVENSHSEVLMISSHYLQVESMPDDRVKNSRARMEFYELIEKKLRKNQDNNYKFKRIIQIPNEMDITDINDSIYIKHMKLLSDYGECVPELICLKQCDVYANSTYYLVDKRILLWQIIGKEPNKDNVFTLGYFIFENMNEDFIKEFSNFFHRIDAHSNLVPKNTFD